MIDLEQLTTEQRWGLQFATMQHNAKIAEGEPTLSEQQYADRIFSDACDSYFAALVRYKEQLALERVRQMSPSERDALIAQIQLPEVLP